MKNGLYAVTLWQGSNVAVIRVGWFARDDGDEWHVWWVTPYRKDYSRLAEVWLKGPTSVKGWEWSPVVESYVSRLHFAPLAKLDPAVWVSVCPQPKEWRE